jgi:hypothetical protein
VEAEACTVRGDHVEVVRVILVLKACRHVGEDLARFLHNKHIALTLLSGGIE